jgi:hypothetical protein
MVVSITEVVVNHENDTANVVPGGAVAIEVVEGTSSPIQTSETISVIETVSPGGTVVNVGAGPAFPPDPYEGQIWILT